MKDLRYALKDHHDVLALAESRDAATIVLVVTSREKAQVTAGFFGAARDCTVRVKFLFRESETEMSASAAGGRWRVAGPGTAPPTSWCNRSSAGSKRTAQLSR